MNVNPGDIVMVTHYGVRINGAYIVPAVVTQVFPGSECVNLLAFPPLMVPQHLSSVKVLDHAVTHEFAYENPDFIGCWGRDSTPAHA
jgi:hypothetical protein